MTQLFNSLLRGQVMEAMATRVVLLWCVFLLAACNGADPEPAAGPLPPPGTAEGELAPAVTGTTTDGDPWALDPEVFSHTLLVFYRDGGCGLCRLRLEELERYIGGYESAGVQVFAVTPEPPGEARATRERADFSGEVMSTDSATLVEWEVLDEPGGAVMPGSYLLDRRGAILYRHVGRNAADRASDVEILAALRQSLQPGGSAVP